MFYTYKQLYLEVKTISKGMSYHDATRYYINKQLKTLDQCHLCGRQPDHLYHYIKLTPIYLPDNITNPVQDVCQYCSQGTTIHNIYTDTDITNPKVKIPLPLLDAWHYITLQLSYALRFIYYYIYYCVIIYIIDKYNLDWAKRLGRWLGV